MKKLLIILAIMAMGVSEVMAQISKKEAKRMQIQNAIEQARELISQGDFRLSAYFIDDPVISKSLGYDYFRSNSKASNFNLLKKGNKDVYVYEFFELECGNMRYDAMLELCGRSGKIKLEFHTPLTGKKPIRYWLDVGSVSELGVDYQPFNPYSIAAPETFYVIKYNDSFKSLNMKYNGIMFRDKKTMERYQNTHVSKVLLNRINNYGK